jgi:hypothetical protein
MSDGDDLLFNDAWENEDTYPADAFCPDCSRTECECHIPLSELMGDWEDDETYLDLEEEYGGKKETEPGVLKFRKNEGETPKYKKRKR